MKNIPKIIICFSLLLVFSVPLFIKIYFNIVEKNISKLPNTEKNYSTNTLNSLNFSVAPTNTLTPTLKPTLKIEKITTTNINIEKNLSWIKNQITKTGMIDSYKDTQDICYLYDEAVAAIALVKNGDIQNTKNLLLTLQKLQSADGSWNTAYFCNTLGIQESTKHVGPVMWVDMAIAHYEKKTGDKSFHDMAIKSINWSLQFLQSDGGINGGLNYDGTKLLWASTEHNQDAYVVLKYFGFSNESKKVKNFLENIVWNSSQKRWLGGRGDSNDPMDVNAWGISALESSDRPKYSASIDYVLNKHRTKINAVDAFDFNSDKNDIWLEGTGQMSIALHLLGKDSDAKYFQNEILKTQSSTGGIPYSLKGTNNGYWQMATNESLSATGWFIFAVQNINPFDL